MICFGSRFLFQKYQAYSEMGNREIENRQARLPGKCQNKESNARVGLFLLPVDRGRILIS